MYATKSRTNMAITATHWNGTSWSNGSPNAVKDAHINADYTTASGSFSCRDLVITTTAILTIVTDSYIKVLRNLNQSATSKMIIKDKADLMFLHKAPLTESAKVQIEAILPNHQLLDYEFLSSPISGIPLKSISPGTLDNRFYIYNEATSSFTLKNPHTTLISSGAGYQIRVPNYFTTTIADWLININNFLGGVLKAGIIRVQIEKLSLGFNHLGNPYTSILDARLFLKYNNSAIWKRLYLWKKTNAAQGITYHLLNGYTKNMSADKFVNANQAFMVQKISSVPNEVVFTPDMMLRSQDFSPPDRLYIIIHQSGVNFPIGGVCYDLKKFPVPFEDVINTSTITIIDNGYKIICRKDSFAITDVIKLRALFDLAATYTISLTDALGRFEDLEHVYLVDSLLGITHNLKTSGYTFTSAAGEFLTRFQIKFQI